jgi:hypothetical protein
LIARLTRYSTDPAAVDELTDEVIAVARAQRGATAAIERRAEFFLVEPSKGDCLSIVAGDNSTVCAVVELPRLARGEPQEYDVVLLQLGGPRGSGVVDALYGRVVYCAQAGGEETSAVHDVPASPHVWARAMLLGPDELVAFAVGTDRGVLEQTLGELVDRPARSEDYGEVAYHFSREAEVTGRPS